MAPRSRNSAVDRHIGAAIRARRLAMGISQTVLAGHLGLTFQQVQKYERGTNRVSASTLYEIAAFLATPMPAFLDGLPLASGGESESLARVKRFLETKEAATLADLFPRIGSPRRRRAILGLMRAMAEDA